MERLLELNSSIGNSLYNLLFHYNHYTEKWACFRNEDKENYFNGSKPTFLIGVGYTQKEAYENQKHSMT